MFPSLPAYTTAARTIPAKFLFPPPLLARRARACRDSPSWRWPGLAPPEPPALRQEPSAPGTTTGPPFACHFFNLQQVLPSAWLFIKLGTLPPLTAENPPSAGRWPPTPILISSLFHHSHLVNMSSQCVSAWSKIRLCLFPVGFVHLYALT